MKIKLTRPEKAPEIISIEDVRFICVKISDGLEYYFYNNPMENSHNFEILDEENKGCPELDVKQPTQKPMSALEHLQKVKELIG